MVRRATLLLGAAAVLVTTGSGGVSSAVGGGTSSAEAFAIQVSVPGRGGSVAGAVSAPPDAVGVGGAFAYPADGSVVQAASVSSSVSADSGVSNATVAVSGLSLFGGEVTVGSVTVKAGAKANAKGASGSTSGSAVSGMVVAGQPVATPPNGAVPLGDWGTATVLQQSGSAYRSNRTRGYNAGVTALQIHLNVEHAGLPAGTDVVVGYADVAAEATPPERAAARPGDDTQRRIKPRVNPPNEPQASRPRTPPVRNVPTDVIPRLTATGYVFPVYGAASFTNSFNAPRATTTWHHGEDIFAPLGAPVLAVANGIVYSVGWNEVGGLRFWLQDLAGNEFYYAHLSAFSPLAINGAQVRAGDVIGFVGNTGDAEHTPYHLHFEIHPVSLLYRGYDGSAVPPYPYLTAWKRLTDLPFTAVSGWAPPLSDSSRAPKPGAILLQSRDISSASGLEPGSLRRALRSSGTSVADGSLAGMVPRGRAGLRALARALSGPMP
ncbi:MAG TPA: M23 family metallopeptidase [Gaiellaceae bacterium]|nr:M23 family metallopeptidase [Gaiellaceae bacterium]HET8652271.1 M23 family metallopeptidase [Gaiellaceae bacterium]